MVVPVQLDMKRFISFLAVLAVVTSAFGDGFIVVHDWPPGPRPPVWPGPHPYAFAPLEVAYHHVNVKIDGQIATTSVDEEFYNPNPQQLEGTYLFPVPKGCWIKSRSVCPAFKALSIR